ncbi:nucleotidyltransferase domain-containing protein [bacterium]|nr:nucleotidyltransferase domain-containing protein [bacterium]MBU1753323.1 nucleotidyltransferase domain-containing protein [bacterium]
MAKQISLGEKEINLINRYVCLIKQKGIKVSKVILFGSHAKGMAEPDSDIDIAIISSQFGQNNLKEMMLLRKLALEIDSHIEPLPFSPQDIENRYSTLSQEIKKYGVLI